MASLYNWLDEHKDISKKEFVAGHKDKDTNETSLENIYDAWKKKNSSTNNDSNPKGNTSTAAGTTITGMKDVLAAGENYALTGAKQEFVSVNDLYSKVFTAEGKLKSGTEIFKAAAESAFNTLSTYYQQQSALITEINTKTGLTGELSKQFRQELTQANITLTQYGITLEELSNAATKLVSESGRFLLYNRESFDLFAKVGQAYVGSLEKLTTMLPQFEKVGIGGVSAAKAIGEAGQGALNLGLNSQKVTGMIGDNIGKLNQYGFQRGIQGLSEMSRKAIEFRTEMSTAFSIAEKVMDPKGALEFSAKLQVIGGAIGAFGDPLKLMYMATNNVEGLQDAFIKAAGGLATYNAEQGKFEINSLNLRRVRDMADATGQSVENLTNTAIAFQERAFAKNQLISLNLDKDQEEFITNLSRMEGGKMVVDLQGTSIRNEFAQFADKNGRVTLETISQNKGLRDAILANQEDFKKQTPEKIIASQASDVRQIMRYVSYLAASMRNTAGSGASEIFGKMIDKDLKGNIIEGLKSGAVEIQSLSKETKAYLEKNGVDVKATIANLNKTNNESSQGKQVDIIMKKQEEQKKEAVANASKTSNTPQEVNMNMNIKSENITDGWAREMMRDSSLAESLFSVNPRKYTSPEKIK